MSFKQIKLSSLDLEQETVLNSCKMKKIQSLAGTAPAHIYNWYFSKQFLTPPQGNLLLEVSFSPGDKTRKCHS